MTSKVHRNERSCYFTVKQESSSAKRYIAELDGLRGIAVIAVLFYHFDMGISGGYVGVDIFFVLSGFLITRIIWNACESGTFSLVDFWQRRLRRLGPALIVSAAVTLFAGYILYLPSDLSQIAASIVSTAFFASNIYFWRNTGYFSAENIEKPFLHTWSLSVEEQF